jgi:hypothetical protein
LERTKATNAEKLEYLKQLTSMNVDLTQCKRRKKTQTKCFLLNDVVLIYIFFKDLTSQYQKPDRLIQIDGGGSGGGGSTGIHLHDN